MIGEDEAIPEEHIHKYDLPLKGRKPICIVHIGFLLSKTFRKLFVICLLL